MMDSGVTGTLTGAASAVEAVRGAAGAIEPLTGVGSVVDPVAAPSWLLSPDGSTFPLLLLAIGLAIGGTALYRYLRLRRKREDLSKLVARDPRLERTVIPCGLRPDQLAWWCRGLPKGDRRYGLDFGVEGPLRTDLGVGFPEETNVAAFRWWWEVKSRNRNRNGRTTTSYSKRYLPTALVRLPVTLDQRVLIGPESVLGRVGLTRGGQQLESSEFNRSFRVEARDEELSLYLLDAGFQQLLVEDFKGRTIELFGELLLVAGEPDHRDASLTGVIGELPAMRQDAHRILHAIPAAFWRRVGAGSSASPTDGIPEDALDGWQSDPTDGSAGGFPGSSGGFPGWPPGGPTGGMTS